MEYVNIFAKLANQVNLDSILMCFRKKKDWQEGRYNLVGGSMKPGESIVEAAIRELKEETGLDPAVPNCEKVMGAITGSWGVVHCVKITVPHALLSPAPGEEDVQHVSWRRWQDMANNSLLIPNLRVIVPMMFNGVTDWVIQDEGPTWETETHDFKIAVRSDNKRING